MNCPLCGSRRARRACPALGHEICPVCCGTKRLVSIRCPDTCAYLASARTHPPAVVVRQRDRDARFVVPLVHDLTESAYVLLMMLQEVVKRYRPTAIPPLQDADVAEAAASLASTFETASRGIIFEHRPANLAAERLANELRSVLEQAAKSSGRPSLVERHGPDALRRLERAARDARTQLEPSDTAYLDLLDRLPYPGPDGQGGGQSSTDRPTAEEAAPRIIVP